MAELYDEFQAEGRRELLDIPIIHGNAGDVIRGRFVEVIDNNGVEFVKIDPNNGYPAVALESPGFKDLFQRSDSEIQETYALENNLLYFTDASIRVEARAVQHTNGRIIWHIEPLLDRKFSEPVRGSELAEQYKQKIIPELVKEKDAALQIRRSLGLLEVEGEAGRELRYPRAKTPFEILQQARDDVGGEEYKRSRQLLSQAETEDRKLQKEIERLESIVGHQIQQDKEVPQQLQQDLERLKQASQNVSNEYLAARAEYRHYSLQLEKEDARFKVKDRYREIFKSEQAMLLRRERADKHFTQALNSLRVAEALSREYRALGNQHIEVERSANGLILPSNRRELEQKLDPSRAKGVEPAKQQAGLER